MHKYFKYILVVLSIGIINYSDAQSTFNITTTFGVDVARNIIPTDSGYFTDITSGQPVLPRYAILCFYDTLGNLKWNKVYGDSLELYDDGTLFQDSIGNFIMGATFSSLAIHHYKFALRKVSQYGDSIWVKYYSPDSIKEYFGKWICQSSDNGFVITGQKSDSTDANIYALKTDSAGNYLWQYELVGNHYDGAFDAAETMNQDYLVVGWTDSYGNGNINNSDAIVVCLDSTGNYKWKKTFGKSNISEIMYRISKTKDYNFLICGAKYVTAGYNIASIWKIDSFGNSIWQKYYSTISDLSIFYGIHELPNGNIVTVGSDRDTSTHKDQGWIVILDSLGNIIKERRMTVGNDHCIFNDVKQTKDGGFIIAGYVFGGPNGEDGWLVKLDSNLCDVAGCGISTEIHENTNYANAGNVILYPNPCTTDLFIRPQFGLNIRSATVYDLSGKEMSITTYGRRELFQISTINLAPGIYFAKLKTDKGDKTVKFIKQ